MTLHGVASVSLYPPLSTGPMMSDRRTEQPLPRDRVVLNVEAVWAVREQQSAAAEAIENALEVQRRILNIGA